MCFLGALHRVCRFFLIFLVQALFRGSGIRVFRFRASGILGFGAFGRVFEGCQEGFIGGLLEVLLNSWVTSDPPKP